MRRRQRSMLIAPIIFAALILFLGSPASASRLLPQQPAQPPAQSSGPQNTTASQPAQVAKACPSSADSTTAKPADCTPASSNKSKKQSPAQTSSSSATGSTKTVVRNGSTTDPTVAISPSESDLQASHQLKSTNRLLASTEMNLKQLVNRPLDADQQATVKQIKSYMEQARAASQNGEMQRAYTLAHKANMLSADLLGLPQ